MLQPKGFTVDYTEHQQGLSIFWPDWLTCAADASSSIFYHRSQISFVCPAAEQYSFSALSEPYEVGGILVWLTKPKLCYECYFGARFKRH